MNAHAEAKSTWEIVTATPSLWEPLGYVLITVTIWVVLASLLRQVWPEVYRRMSFVVVVGTAVGALVLVFVLQWLALTDWGQNHLGPFSVLLRIIGWGYSQVHNPDLNFQDHLLAWIAGVGILEESVKLLLGLAIADLYLIRHKELSDDQLDPSQRRFQGDEEPAVVRRFSACLVLSGMAFGAGESLWYFRMYSAAHVPVEYYLLRATILILLHGSWSLMAFHLSRLGDEDLGDGVWGFFWFLIKTVLAVLPVAVLHGLYNTSVQQPHQSPELAFVVAGASLASALLLLIRLTRKS
jgi:hypothetical protein